MRAIRIRTQWPLIAVSLLTAGSVSRVLPQTVGEEIVTDRPDITESAIVVPKASLQVENGITWTNNRSNSALAICQTLLRLGIRDHTELRLVLPAYVQSISGAHDSSGISDIAVGFKRQLGPLPGGIDVSLIVATSLPTGGSVQTTHRADPFFKIPWSRELGEGWSIGGMASLFWPTEEGRRNLTWEPTFVVEREITRSLDAFIEYGGDYPQRGGSRQIIHFGTAYRINSTNQLDFHFGFGLSPATPRNFFAAGYSFRVDRLWAK